MTGRMLVSQEGDKYQFGGEDLIMVLLVQPTETGKENI